MNPIESRQNEKFRTWVSLTSSKGIKKEGLFLLSGEKLVPEYLRLPSLEFSAELVPKGLTKLTQDRKNIFELPKELFAEIDELGTHFNILVLKTPEIPMWIHGSETHSPAGGGLLRLPPSETHSPAGGGLVRLPPSLEIFCPLGDPTNVGALIRNAEAFGAQTVILTEESANPFLPKAVKASAGSILRVPLKHGPKLRELPKGLIVLDSRGTALPNFHWPQKSQLLVGEEGQGLEQYSGGTAVSIPILGVESLNASVSVGVALYDRSIKLSKESVSS